MSIGQSDYFEDYLHGPGDRRIIARMPLTEQDKLALKEQIATLLELNEPESILATLGSVAQRMAHSVTRGAITELEALRWQALADACASVEKELERANAPRQTPQDGVMMQDRHLQPKAGC